MPAPARMPSRSPRPPSATSTAPTSPSWRALQRYEQRGLWRQAAAVAHDWDGALRQARRLEQALNAFSRAALCTARAWSGTSRDGKRISGEAR
jgi:hypothetical protein